VRRRRQAKEPEAAEPEAKAESKPAPDPEPAPEPAPPPPKSWKAQAELAPVKGVKIKAATVTFAQEEGGQVTVASTGWFDGIKAGKYHLVVHESADCGANAAKAGKAVAASDMLFSAAKGTDSLDVGKGAALQLNGDSTIVGHTLVLTVDKKGKPGKSMACGPIVSE
jgi:hypothetical protein